MKELCHDPCCWLFPSFFKELASVYLNTKGTITHKTVKKNFIYWKYFSSLCGKKIHHGANRMGGSGFRALIPKGDEELDKIISNFFDIVFFPLMDRVWRSILYKRKL